MRISIRQGDPGYDPTHSRRVKRVTVDGVEVTAVTADEEQGFVHCLQMDPSDPTRVLRDGVGNYLLKALHGKVVIELLHGDRDWDQRRRGEAKVRVGRCPRSKDIIVQVYSVVRPGAIKQGRMVHKLLPSGDAAVCQKAGITAGALAEMLAEQFGDTIDPSAAARAAVEGAHAMLLDERRIVVDPYAQDG